MPSLTGRRLFGCVLILSAAPALSQTSDAPRSSGVEVSREASPVEQQSRSLRLAPVTFDLAGATSIDGQI